MDVKFIFIALQVGISLCLFALAINVVHLFPPDTVIWLLALPGWLFVLFLCFKAGEAITKKLIEANFHD
jgi:hypothetical protein